MGLIDLIYQRGVLAIGAAISVIFLLSFWETDGARSILSVAGIMALSWGLLRLPYILESKLTQPKKRVNAFGDVLLLVTSRRWGPNGIESEDKMRVKSDSYDGECVNLVVSFNPRKVDRLEISPIRRPLDDSDGIVGDAERLANEPF